MIPVERILSRLDSLFDKGDFAAAENLLLYWLSEARSEEDRRGEFAILNELMGFYRKTDEPQKCRETVKTTLELTEKMGIKDSIGGATALLNCGTSYKFLGDTSSSLKHYEAARMIYERELEPNDSRLAGLYNNMALCLTDAERFSDAEELYLRAIEVNKALPHGELNAAISYVNLAELCEKSLGALDAEERIAEYLENAELLFDSESVDRDGYYAFVAEKCAPAFEYYGFFFAAQKLVKRAEDIRKEACDERN